MKIKNLGTLHSVSSGKMDENGRSSYSHLKLTFRLLLCAWIIACSWNQRGALWRQSWLLSCSLWSLSFFSAWRCFLEKQRWTCKKQDLKPLMAGNMAFCFKSWGLMFTDPHLAPSRQSRKLTQQLNPSASSLSFSSWSAITLYTCTQLTCASYLNPRNLLSVLDQDMAPHPYIKFHVVTTQTPLQNEVVVYHSGNGTLQNCHCFVWLASQCHGR